MGQGHKEPTLPDHMCRIPFLPKQMFFFQLESVMEPYMGIGQFSSMG